jgi:hypothetical protein
VEKHLGCEAMSVIAVVMLKIIGREAVAVEGEDKSANTSI